MRWRLADADPDRVLVVFLLIQKLVCLRGKASCLCPQGEPVTYVPGEGQMLVSLREGHGCFCPKGGPDSGVVDGKASCLHSLERPDAYIHWDKTRCLNPLGRPDAAV